MKDKVLNKHIIILISILIFTCNIILCQPDDKNIPADKLREKITLFTDRDIYCVGESLFFRAYNLSNQQLKSLSWSTVMYIELLTPEGKSVFQYKYRYDTTGASGKINITDDILTGNYYLRAYTKWMRNFSVYNYFYKIIKIINPYQAELLKPQSGLTIISESHIIDSLRNPDFEIKTDKQVYQKREKVVLTVHGSNHLDSPANYCISVIKSGTVKEYLFPLPLVEVSQFQPDYIPETRSATLTGKVISRKNLLPIPFMHISLSVFNSTKNTFTTLTDKYGHFYFSLPELTRETEVYISSLQPNGELEPVILVDNDFCSKEVQLPFVQLSQGKEEQDLYNELIFNAQISNKYHVVHHEERINSSSETIPFYGITTQSVHFSDFIPLPSIEDYFNEFIPSVVIRKRNREKYFQVLGPYSDLYIFKPLVLVDYVALNNVEWILSISPKKVDRIEIVDKPYMMGDICYGGIIHIISVDGDFAGVNLPSSGQFFKFMLYASPDSIHLKKPENPRIPDVRNLLYWNPMVQLKNRQSETHAFFTGDTPGEYMAIIRGVDKMGHEISNWCKFIVQ